MNVAWLANSAWSALNAARLAQFEHDLRDPRPVQEQLLAAYLRRSSQTALGARLGLPHVRSMREFQDRVPLSTYDDYAADIARVRRGESRVLSFDPVRRFLPSSGSTAARKLVPQTAQYQREIDRAVGVWIADLYRSWPQLKRGPAYWSISPAIDTPEQPGAVPIGFEDDAAWLGRWLQPLVRAVMAVPSHVQHIRELSEHRFATLRHLVAADELRLISVWHPTFLLILLDALPEMWERLLRSLETGTAFERRRARELSRVDPGRLKAIWPKLTLVSAWADAHAAEAFAQLRERLPGVHLQPKGLIATEACVSIPFAGARPLAYRSHFFEFVDAAGRVHLLDELEIGGAYDVVVSTGSGFLRYRLHDRVRVDGKLGRTPCISFIGKTDLVSDLRGEKLSDGFVAAALQAVLEPRRLDVRFAMLAPAATSGPATASYVLYIEAARAADAALAGALDTALSENPHYALCRKLGQLACVRVFEIASGAQRAYIERALGEGRRLGDIKPVALSKLPDWDRHFVARRRSESQETAQHG